MLCTTRGQGDEIVRFLESQETGARAVHSLEQIECPNGVDGLFTDEWANVQSVESVASLANVQRANHVTVR